MNILIPCGGLGERFSRERYREPKPLICAMGKPVIVWLLDELNIGPDDTLVIAYNVDLERWRMEDRLRKALHSRGACLRIVHLPHATRGAAETVAIALEKGLTPVECQRKTMLFDCDTFYRRDIVSTFRSWPHDVNMSVVFRDEGTSPIYSYCELLSNDRIGEIREKTRISPWANTGCYSFACGTTLLQYCRLALGRNVGSECYISSVISTMLSEKHPFQALPISAHDFVCLGTPLQLRLFCATEPTFAPRRVCFDLDGTLVTHPIISGDYNTVKPYHDTIQFARYLKSLGNIIIIQTARGMRSCEGNMGLVHTSAARAVYAILEQLDIPCDELFFGKPYAHVYIDDLAQNVCEDIQKSTGFYVTGVSERKHNTLESATLRTLVKRSTIPLDGEIHWYKNIPPSIRHLFPAFIRAAPDASWYEVERLECTTCANLYVNECLTPEHVRRIIKVLTSIHESTLLSEEDMSSKRKLMYGNYTRKLCQRYADYDYSMFPDASLVYRRLLNALQKYEDQDCGNLGVVHGDAVLSNILMERGEELRFIDMRGKLDDVVTIVGDKWYDYAKIYQSLVGYDEILLERRVHSAYRETLLSTFVEEMTTMYGPAAIDTVRLLSASLFFTLIPLHDNDKCNAYFSMCSEILGLVSPEYLK